MDKGLLVACERAAGMVCDGSVVAYPTEAVYGLGCDPWQEKAVQKILDIKQRPRSKGLIVLAATWEACAPHVQPLPEDRLQTILASWPGPYTWLLPNKDFPDWITGDHDTVAIRISAHPIAAKLCELAGGLLVSTSANHSGEAPMRTPFDFVDHWENELALIVSGPVGELKQPTRIRDAISGLTIR